MSIGSEHSVERKHNQADSSRRVAVRAATTGSEHNRLGEFESWRRRLLSEHYTRSVGFDLCAAHRGRWLYSKVDTLIWGQAVSQREGL